MSRPSSEPETTAKLADEHRDVNRGVARLKRLAARTDILDTYTEWRVELLEVSRAFESLLREHFAHEEDGGFLRDVLSRVPNSQRSVETLRHEHDEIGAALVHLIDDLERTQEANAADVQRVCQVIEDIAESLHTHEIAEQQLIQRTYYREYGGRD